jgi:hypothetical protein
MHPYRIFVSYTHGDRPLALKLVEYLESLGLNVLWDQAIKPGDLITESIIGSIPRAHVFIPLLTEKSHDRPWVHQETGLALGMRVPCLPVATSRTPGQMIQDMKAVVLRGKKPNFKECLPGELIERAAEKGAVTASAAYEVADTPERRTQLIAEYAGEAFQSSGSLRLRLMGAFSSFCIPDKPPGHPMWQLREGLLPRSPEYHRLQRDERRNLEKHAKGAGCDLIICPSLKLARNGEEARRVRLATLVDFLKTAKRGKIRVVVRPGIGRRNVIIVGDEVAAVSAAPRAGKGYAHTTITRHAPSVLRELREFDDLFNTYFDQHGRSPEESREHAVKRLEEIIRESEQSEARKPRKKK